MKFTDTDNQKLIQSYDILSKIHSPNDLKMLDIKELKKLSKQIKSYLENLMSKVEGHSGSNFGIIETTIALHYFFNSPQDDIIFDIGHQSYVHKILTGRLPKMNTIRQPNGISGFCRTKESIHDKMEGGHSSTAISYSMGLEFAKKLNNKNNSKTICVIGDASIASGMALEALNGLADIKNNLIIILNDNCSSISDSTGGLKKVFSYLSGKRHTKITNIEKKFSVSYNALKKMNINYIGPVDGHSIKDLICTFKSIEQSVGSQHATIIHCVTKKGGNGNKKFSNHQIAHSNSEKTKKECLTSAVKESLHSILNVDKKAVIVNPAMLIGNKIEILKSKFPTRVIDTGIAEQHAITFAGGIAANVNKVFCMIYSTFIQRGFDQVIHDIGLQNLPVVFLLDRAGISTGDAPTHHGLFDIVLFSKIPNMICMAPSSSEEIFKMMKLSYLTTNRPSVIRYPKNSSFNSREEGPFSIDLDNIENIELGKAKCITQYKDSKIAIYSYGDCLSQSIQAVKVLKAKNIYIDLFDARFANPVDKEQIVKSCNKCSTIITIEEGVAGGFGANVLKVLNENNKTNQLISLTVDYKNLDSVKTRENSLEVAGISVKHIINTVNKILSNE